ncbi:MAG: hypothetical protein Q4C06_05875 [Bacillota bacterium]|nr:hypothetical protein [Bacillota bacterium]
MKKWISLVTTTALLCTMTATGALAAETAEAEKAAKANKVSGVVTQIDGDTVTLELSGKKHHKGGKPAADKAAETTEATEETESTEAKEKPARPEGEEAKEKPVRSENAEADEKADKKDKKEKEALVLDLAGIVITTKADAEAVEISVDELEIGMRLTVELDEEGNAASAHATQQMQKPEGKKAEKTEEETTAE